MLKLFHKWKKILTLFHNQLTKTDMKKFLPANAEQKDGLICLIMIPVMLLLTILAATLWAQPITNTGGQGSQEDSTQVYTIIF